MKEFLRSLHLGGVAVSIGVILGIVLEKIGNLDQIFYHIANKFLTVSPPSVITWGMVADRIYYAILAIVILVGFMHWIHRDSN